MVFVPELVVFVPIRLRNQIWDKYHGSGTQLWLRAQREEQQSLVWSMHGPFREMLERLRETGM